MRLLFLCVLVCVSINSYTQEFDKQNIYYQALKLHFQYIEKQHNKCPDLWSIESPYLIEEDYYITKGFPDFVDKFKIKVLSSSEIKEKTKNKESITLLTIRPAKWHDSKLVINIVEFSVSRNGNDYSYVNLMDGTPYQVVYNSNSKQYSLIPIK